MNQEPTNWEWDGPAPTEAPKREVTLSEMEAMAAEIRDQRVKCDGLESDLKAEKKILDSLEKRFVATLEDLGKKNYDSAVGKFSISHRTSVKLPQGEDKKAFFDYLKERGIFEDMISVHSATLTAWYKEEQRKATEDGTLLDFNVPGIEGVTITPTLSFRKG